MTQDSFRISFAPLSLQEVYQLADDGANGAIVLMSGTVREQTDGKPVIYLDYQAYEPIGDRGFPANCSANSANLARYQSSCHSPSHR
jgi:molybdopterin synthase catalytic subunit